MRVEQTALALRSGHDPLYGGGEIGHGDLVGATAGGDDRRLVHQIGEIGAGEPGRDCRHLVEIDIGGKLDPLDMDSEDRFAPFPVGTIEHDLTVEAAGPQQRRIEDFRPVGGGEQNDALAWIEAIEFGQELVERLLLLVVTAETTRTPRGPCPGRRARR